MYVAAASGCGGIGGVAAMRCVHVPMVSDGRSVLCQSPSLLLHAALRLLSFRLCFFSVVVSFVVCVCVYLISCLLSASATLAVGQGSSGFFSL